MVTVNVEVDTLQQISNEILSKIFSGSDNPNYEGHASEKEDSRNKDSQTDKDEQTLSPGALITKADIPVFSMISLPYSSKLPPISSKVIF